MEQMVQIPLALSSFNRVLNQPEFMVTETAIASLIRALTKVSTDRLRAPVDKIADEAKFSIFRMMQFIWAQRVAHFFCQSDQLLIMTMNITDDVDFLSLACRIIASQ